MVCLRCCAFCEKDSSFVPPLVYAMLGSSKDVAVGTVAVASLLIASMFSKEVSASQNPGLYLHLAFTATFFAGVFEAALGFLRYDLYLYFSIYLTTIYICSSLQTTRRIGRKGTLKKDG